ncbi:H-NS family nucleoid-associated regulatory protein [Cereibacter sphaeroides]|uniref:H-NS family nucleoid-associated regulatory protein n=1 Tax=Cereibacter sphaeroides TaxID=1063 RepID=UPI001F18BD93|nr:H-NS family nucleoid-associated regulatory protein [Cereibacter sphaeroides]MCE6967063.1 H-NS histone family protein [Cereibacter sphaeroides]
MTASVTRGRALRYAGGSARGLLHHHPGHCPFWFCFRPSTRRPGPRRTSRCRASDRAHSNQIWCGRGRRPRWFTQAMAAGRRPEDLMI